MLFRSVEKESSKVAVVGCFFPPTDFLNYGKEGEVALGDGTLKGYWAPFDFHEVSKGKGGFAPITDPEKRKAIGKQISPVYHASKDSAPSLIIHGDADKLVPVAQSKELNEALKAAGVESELIVMRGAGHGPGVGTPTNIQKMGAFFDKHLKPAKK